jgi:hypothetical protein
MSKSKKPKPVTEIGEFECRAVIGEVVRRGVSMMCGKPIVPSSKFRFCRAHHDQFLIAPDAHRRAQVPARK